MIGLGEALALGNTARVSQGHPLTDATVRAIDTKNRIDLAERHQKAQDALARQKMRQSIYDKIDPYKGGVSMWNAEKARQEDSKSYADQFYYAEKGDVENQAKARIAGDMAHNSRLKNDELVIQPILKHAASDGSYFPKELSAAIANGDRKQVIKFMEDNPYQNMISYDKATDEITGFNPAKEDNVQTTLEKLKQEQGFYSEPTGKKRYVGNDIIEERAMPKALQDVNLQSVMQNDDFMAKLLIKDRNKIDEQRNILKSDPKYAQATDDEIKNKAIENVVRQKVEPYFKRDVTIPQYHPPESAAKNAPSESEEINLSADSGLMKSFVTAKMKPFEYKIQPIGKDADGKPIYNEVERGIYKQGEQEAAKLFMKLNPTIKAIKDPKGSPFSIDGKTFDGKNIQIMSIGNDRWFVGNANAEGLDELFKLQAENADHDHIIAKMKEVGIYDANDPQVRTVLETQNPLVKKTLGPATHSNTNTGNHTTSKITVPRPPKKP